MKHQPLFSVARDMEEVHEVIVIDAGPSRAISFAPKGALMSTKHGLENALMRGRFFD